MLPGSFSLIAIRVFLLKNTVSILKCGGGLIMLPGSFNLIAIRGFLPKNTVQMLKRGGGSIMLPGSLSLTAIRGFLLKNTVSILKRGGILIMLSGSLSLIAISGFMKSKKYMKILDENLQLSSQNLDLGWRFTFKQDNHLKHTFKLVTAMLPK